MLVGGFGEFQGRIPIDWLLRLWRLANVVWTVGHVYREGKF